MKLISTYPFVLFFLFASLAYSQQSIKGIVFDEDNIPLVGASVLISGTNQGTQTNFDGYFTLELKESFPTTLQISYVGYNPKTIQVDSSEMISVQLTTSGRFDEVIISHLRRA